MLKRYVLTVLFIVLTGIGAALSLKAAVGVGAWDAMTQSIGYVTAIKVGTVGMALNISCVVGQIILKGKQFKPFQLIQVVVSIVLGIVVNFFFYNVLGNLVLNQYFIQLLVLLVAYILIALSVSMVIMLGIVTFPLEGLCLAIEEKTPFKFAKIRQFVDVLSVAVALLLTQVFALPMTIREGTVIGMLIFGPLLGFFIKHLQEKVNRL